MKKVWGEEAWKDYLDWHDTDKRKWKKINELIRDIERGDPYEGIGHPHRLSWDRREFWSRHT